MKYEQFCEDLANLEFGETLQGLDKAYILVRLPGGYVYQSCYNGGSCFVPECAPFLDQYRKDSK